jgi:methyl-accepting chemotaxis protein
MRFRPSDRISTSQALDMIRSISDSANTGEEAKDKMDEAKDEMDEAKDDMDEAKDEMDEAEDGMDDSYLCITPADARVEVA